MDHAAFIREHTRVHPVPLTPEICLHLADEAVPLWYKTEEELERQGLPPPFWAFAWAGGQALARYVLDHPGTVREKRVLDFASGSGLVGIAAALAGAASVISADIDAFAHAAIVLNARRNGITLDARLDDLAGSPLRDIDVVLGGDVFYERDLAEKLALWFSGLHDIGIDILVGDPGRSYLPLTQLQPLATYQVPVTRDLEDAEIKKTRVWRFVGAP